MNMTTLRQKSKIFIWVVLTGFFLSMVGVMGSSGGGFLGGANLTSFFSTSLNTNLYVGKIGDKKITRNEFAREIDNQRRTNQFQMNATESFYIGSAWNQLIRNTISDEIIKDLNLKTQNKELMHFLYTNPPAVLQNFLMDSTQNRNGDYFKDTLGNFDLEQYQYTIDNNIDWMSEDLILSLSRYENVLKSDYLPNEKLRNLYNKLSHVSDDYVKEDIRNSNTNCNVDILTINFNDIADSLLNIPDSEIEKYYDDNKEEKFKNPESVTMEYVIFENIEDEDDSLEIILNEDQKQLAIEFALDCEIMPFNEALESYNLQSKDTIDIIQDFNNNSGIPIAMGYDRRIVRFAFDNSKNTISERFSTDNGNAVFHILGNKNESFKNLTEVETEIKDSMINDKKKEFAENEINKMLENNMNFKDILSNCNYCSLSEGEESNISGSFKTTGKNYKVMGALSVMQDGNNSKIIDSGNKLFLLKLNKKYDFDSALIEENFNSSKETITNNIKRSIFNNWMNFMIDKTEKVDLRHKAI